MANLNNHNNQLVSLSLQSSTNLQQLQCAQNPISCLPILPSAVSNLDISNTNVTCLPNIPQGIAVANTLPLCQPNNINGCFAVARIYGAVTKAINCVATNDSLPNFLVSATNTTTNQVFLGNSGASGAYEIAVPLGTYTVSVVPPNAYWANCTNTATINITQSAQQENRDVLLNAVALCADMSIKHTDKTVMRPCSTGVYQINYFNAGTIDAVGAYAEMTLAPEQTFVSATVAFTALGNNRYRFALPDPVRFLTRASFDVSVSTACSAIMGQQLCTDVAVFPHTFCNPPTLWDGSDITVSGRCIGNNQVRFLLTNTGAGPMATAQTYQIIEDNLMIRSGSIQLLAAGSDSVTITADPLRVYRIVVNESPYNPAGNTQETVLVWGCNGLSQNIHWASVNHYPLNSGADYIHHLCTTVRTSFDPNEISAKPTGVGTQHFIANNTLLDYKIDFQNTGNDTAFVVRLLNPIPSNLDLRTLKIGGGSHPFTYSLKANGTLEFLFQNILLPDSTTNEPKSHGFVTYSIRPKANRSEGKTINNQAFIYFDVNPPVATNVYTHTITYNRLVGVETLQNGDISLKIMPNPMQDFTTISLNDLNTSKNLELTLYNAFGQTLKTQNFIENTLVLQRDGLPAGCYFYSIRKSGELVGQGRLMME